LALLAMTMSFGFATVGQGCKLWDCHCRPRLQALGLPLQAKAASFGIATAGQGYVPTRLTAAIAFVWIALGIGLKCSGIQHVLSAEEMYNQSARLCEPRLPI